MQIPAFAEGGFSVYAVDSLGFGGSGKATRPLEGEGYSAGLWGNQILDFITEVVGFTGSSNSLIQQPILAGNAVGPRVALEAARISPASIRYETTPNYALSGFSTSFYMSVFSFPLYLIKLSPYLVCIDRGLLRSTQRQESTTNSH